MDSPIWDAAMISYFDTTLTTGEVHLQTDALAVALLAGGLGCGERVALYLQNVPQYVLALIATWKAAGIAVSVNPMLKTRELRQILDDSGATVLVCLKDLYARQGSAAVAGSTVRRVITTSALDLQTRDDPRLFAGVVPERHEGTEDLLELMSGFGGQHPPSARLGADDIAVITYTSGTTGTPKGATNTHRNVVVGGQTYVVIDAIREHRPTFTVGAITVFIALTNDPAVSRQDLASLRTIASGGAPIPPSVVQGFRDKFGTYIHNVYGMTETTSPTHSVPAGALAPVDPISGALSVGVPSTAATRGSWETTGAEVAAGDDDGWFYLVDRKKDVIVASGYKVWPRDVEDVLYSHDAVLEAAVVGVPDPDRGNRESAAQDRHRKDPAQGAALARTRRG